MLIITIQKRSDFQEIVVEVRRVFFFFLLSVMIDLFLSVL